MRSTYKVLAYLMALEVVIQAAAIAFAVFGLTAWIGEGGVLDKAAMESESVTFTGLSGFIVHGINGQILVPLIAVLLLVVSFFAKLPRGVAYAAAVFGLVVVQVALGIVAHSVPSLGMFHGIVALVLFGAAVMAGRLAVPARAASRDSARVA